MKPSMEHLGAIQQSDLIERSHIPSAVDPQEVLDTVQWKVAVPLSEGNLHQAIRAVFSVWEELHGAMGPRDLLDDPICLWIPDDKACGILEEAGIATMFHFMERRPVDFLVLDQVGEGLVRKFAAVQSRFRQALEEQKEHESKSALPSYRKSVTMCE